MPNLIVVLKGLKSQSVGTPGFAEGFTAGISGVHEKISIDLILISTLISGVFSLVIAGTNPPQVQIAVEHGLNCSTRIFRYRSFLCQK